MDHLNQRLLLDAVGNRHGIVLEPQRAKISLSDIRSIVHIGLPSSLASPWQSASGGIGFDEISAKRAAIGESIERYCASIVTLPLKNKRSIARSARLDAEQWCLFNHQQRSDASFPFGAIYDSSCKYTNVYDLQTNQEVWVPHPFVALRDDYQTGIPTSSGLAAGPSAFWALLRSIQELIERDALMMTWLHSVPGRAIALPAQYVAAVDQLGGEVWAFDLTPAYSPFPVIAVAGGIQKKGKWRYSLGVACRETWQAALEKAYLEWNQGVLFAGIYDTYVDTSSIIDPSTLKSFDEHAIFYTLHPEQWHSLPLFAHKDRLQDISVKGKPVGHRTALTMIKAALKKHNIRLYYRDITTIDARQLGLSVIRATSPDLAAIFAHQQWPLIGNLEDKLASRYPWASANLEFPNKMPHPLG